MSLALGRRLDHTGYGRCKRNRIVGYLSRRKADKNESPDFFLIDASGKQCYNLSYYINFLRQEEPMYKVILFDLDGTLTESGEGITKSVQYALERIGKPEPDLEKLKVFIGPPLMEMFMQYAQIDEATAKQAVEIYRERYSVTGIFENAVYPGIENMLAQLEKKGYILAVASSKPEVYVRQILDHFGLTRYFTEIGGSELNGRRTNKTEVIEDVLKRLNMDKHRDQVIMVGDKEHDVYGARKAGLECIAVSFGYGTEEELKQAEPLKIVDSAEGIVDFFA